MMEGDDLHCVDAFRGKRQFLEADFIAPLRGGDLVSLGGQGRLESHDQLQVAAAHNKKIVSFRIL